MTYWELEQEPWELFPDDSYDGAQWITDRGRKERLEYFYNLKECDRSI